MTSRNQLHLAAFIASFIFSTLLVGAFGVLLYVHSTKWDTEPQILKVSWLSLVPSLFGALRSIVAPRFIRNGLSELCLLASAWLKGL